MKRPNASRDAAHGPMIVSASYKTDIPAFYANWFRARREAGSCTVRNPWNGRDFTVSLADRDVDGFVFWTRNARPFACELARTARTHPFTVHCTITGYPRALERAVAPAEGAIADLHEISCRFGPDCAVWRYDPVTITDETPPEWHVANFRRLAGALAGATNEAVVSFAQIYAKTRRNLDRAATATGNGWRDPEPGEKAELLEALDVISRENAMKLTLCTQPDLAETTGMAAARCIDAARLDRVAAHLGHPGVSARTRGNRPGCLCAEARDIGAYDTCPHGCAYCYAVTDHDSTRRRHRSHDPFAESLTQPHAGEAEGARSRRRPGGPASELTL
jgi:hypothetical protein